MSDLAQAAVDVLRADSAFTGLPVLARSVKFPNGWIFPERIMNVTHEKSQKVMVVINEIDSDRLDPGNTMHKPKLVIDVWADPTRNDDGSVKVFDAKTKVRIVDPFLVKHFHRVDLSEEDGSLIKWGSLTIIGAELAGPEFRPIDGNEGGVFARYTVSLVII